MRTGAPGHVANASDPCNVREYADMKFELFSDYLPAGDQPQAIEKLVDGLSSGLAHQTLLGVT
jgi:hypothetical protein